MIELRATQLETFLSCELLYKNNPPFTWKEEYLTFGTDVHKYIELSLMDESNQLGRDIVLRNRPIKQRDMIIMMWNIVLEQIKLRNLKLVLNEYTSYYIYKDKIKLQGTFDFLFSDENWNLILLDLKTAASSRDEDTISSVKQCKIYPAMLKNYLWITINKFEYWILKKTSIPKLQIVPFDIDDDCYTEWLDNSLKSFLASYDNDIWNSNKPNYKCKYCKIKHLCNKSDWDEFI